MGENASKYSARLPLWIVLAILAGIATGLFFGEGASYLNPVGTVYVMMLQSVVYPYLISSLIGGFGRMDYQKIGRFFKNAWHIYVLLVLVTFILLFILSSAIPSSASRIINPEKEVVGTFFDSFLKVIIPVNPFHSINQNFVPAVVLISVLYGLGLSKLKVKRGQIAFFEQIAKVSVQIWNWIILFSPIGIFALTAGIAGQIQLSHLESVSLYLILVLIGSLFLTFGVLPLVIKIFFPISYRELIGSLQSALLISLVTTLSVVALPFLNRMAKALLKKYEIEGEESNEIVQTSLSISYPFCQLGNFFVYLFMSFSVFYFHRALSFDQATGLPLLSFLSGIGTPSTAINAVSFLSGWLGLTEESLKLFVLLIPITRFPQVILSVMGMATFTLLSCLAYYGKLRLQPRFLYIGVGLYAAFVLIFLSFHGSILRLSPSQEPSLLKFSISPEIKQRVHVSFLKESAESSTVSGEESYLASIKERKVLRVGYNANAIPWCYFNESHELVGFDVAMMYKLAEDLEVDLEFIPFEWFTMLRDIEGQKFDIAIGSVYVTSQRLLHAKFTDPYDSSSSAMIVRNDQVSHFYSLQDILDTEGLKIAVFADPITQNLAEINFPKRDLVVVDNYKALPPGVDAAIWTKSHTDAWVTVNPGYTSMVPKGLIQGWPLQMAYMLNKDADDFLDFMNYWLKIQQTEGFFERQYNLWIDRVPPESKKKRWSVLHNWLQGEK